MLSEIDTSATTILKKLQSNTPFLKKGVYSVADQALFSITNFSVSLLLGRWLSESGYGAYSVAMALFLLLSGQYNSFSLEPLGVLGPYEFRKNPEIYSRFLVVAHLLVSGLLAFIAIVFSILWKNPSSPVILSMAIFSPLILSFWMVRWYFYMQLRSDKSFFVTFFYACMVFVGIFILRTMDSISAITTFGILGIAGLVPFLLVFGKKIIPSLTNISLYKSMIRGNWDYGRWLSIASILQWSTIQIYYLFVTYYQGLEATGALKASQNFAMPYEQFSIAIGLLLIPWTSSHVFNNRKQALKRITIYLSMLMFGLGVIYLLVVSFIIEPLFNVVYAGKYQEVIWLVPLLIGIPMMMSLSRGAQIISRTIRKPKFLLVAYVVSGITSIILGPILIQRFELVGAVAGMLVSTFLFSLILNILCLRHLDRHDLSISS